MKKLCAVAILLTSFATVAQAPTVICPIHHVPAQITGRTQKDGEGRTIAWEYCHSGVNTTHCFWAHD
jgi:opacity protein-like surface antigen